MDGAPAGKTSATLMRRLRALPDDPATWREFTERYGRQVLAWCRHYNLQEADAEDVTQEVLLELARSMRKFEYDPSRSFRAWLKTLTHRAWCDFLEKRRRVQQGSGDSQVLFRLEETAARDDLEKRLAEEYDRELLDAAIFEIRRRVAPNTWEAFRLLAFEGLSGADVAQRLNMNVGNVYVARSSVQKMLKEQLKTLEGT
ncbi:sigma-70 family RNA polymerase sigma factor [soil metagenome]